jgi:hypothetical protein
LSIFPKNPTPISGNLILNGISLSRGAPVPLHYPPPHLKRPLLRSTKPRVKRKKGGRQEKKNLLRYTDYSEQEENDGLHHTSPTHNKKSTIQQAMRKGTLIRRKKRKKMAESQSLDFLSTRGLVKNRGKVS